MLRINGVEQGDGTCAEGFIVIEVYPGVSCHNSPASVGVRVPEVETAVAGDRLDTLKSPPLITPLIVILALVGSTPTMLFPDVARVQWPVKFAGVLQPDALVLPS